MLPPIISTTPNSPTVCAKPSTTAPTKPGRASGTTTVKKRSKVRRAGSLRLDGALTDRLERGLQRLDDEG